jgi:hypothetical protein
MEKWTPGANVLTSWTISGRRNSYTITRIVLVVTACLCSTVASGHQESGNNKKLIGPETIEDNQATSSGRDDVFVWQGLDGFSDDVTDHEFTEGISSRSPEAAGRTLDRHFEVSRLSSSSSQNRSSFAGQLQQQQQHDEQEHEHEEGAFFEPKQTPDSPGLTKRLSASNVLLEYLKNQQERDAREYIGFWFGYHTYL